MIYPEGPKETITTIHCAKYHEEMIEPIRHVLEKHGARLEVLDDHCVLYFPEGTRRQIQYPVTQVDRYTITLPDGYLLHENTSVRPNGLSLLRFSYDEFPDWVQEKYGKKRST